MGVPTLFKNLIKRFPSIITTTRLRNVDVLALDLNSILHTAAARILLYGTYSHYLEKHKPDVFKTQKELLDKMSEEQLMKHLIKELVNTVIAIINNYKPQKKIIIAIDGLAPLGKVNQQRVRRLGSVSTSKESRLHTAILFTVGTQFMRDFDAALKAALNKVKSYLPEITWYSDWRDRGEGEHKIMSELRAATPHDQRILIMGPDTDLMLLSLVMPHTDIWIDRTADSFSGEQRSLVDTSELKRTLYDLNIDFKSFLLATMVYGNDFIPGLVGLDDIDLSFNDLLNLLRDRKLVDEDDYPDRQALFEFLRELAPLQFKYVERIANNFMEFPLAIAQRSFAEYNPEIHEHLRQRSADEYAVVTKNYKDDVTQIKSTITDPQDLKAALRARKDRFEVDLQDIRENSRANDFKLLPKKFTKQWYIRTFAARVVPYTEEELAAAVYKLCNEYFNSIIWVYQYYHDHTNTDWNWDYPYFFGPILQSFNLLNSAEDLDEVDFTNKKYPLTLWGQMIITTPYQFASTLPDYGKEVADWYSPIADMYPIKFQTITEGRTYKESHRFTALLPHIDFDRFIAFQPLIGITVKTKEGFTPSDPMKIRNEYAGSTAPSLPRVSLEPSIRSVKVKEQPKQKEKSLFKNESNLKRLSEVYSYEVARFVGSYGQRYYPDFVDAPVLRGSIQILQPKK